MIPKIETILFPELKDAGHLFPISRFEDTVIIIYIYIYILKKILRKYQIFDSKFIAQSFHYINIGNKHHHQRFRHNY